jgi:hypothetical protein
MNPYLSSTTSVNDNVVSYSTAALEATLSDRIRADQIDGLGKLASALEDFVRGYLLIDDISISTDDEIINWAFAETLTDLAAAIWLLTSGYYKASASSLRNAFDIAVASLYFQIRENRHSGRGYNRFFAEWDRGDRQTPNWGEMKPFIAAQPTVASFVATTGLDPLAAAYDHFKNLCAYTHTSAFTAAGDPVTAINMTGVAPVFDVKYFSRGCGLASKTISLIAILWQVVFPRIAATRSLGSRLGEGYKVLFPPPLGPLVLARR